jgi:hypothetical protein
MGVAAYNQVDTIVCVGNRTRCCKHWNGYACDARRVVMVREASPKTILRCDVLA